MYHSNHEQQTIHRRLPSADDSIDEEEDAVPLVRRRAHLEISRDEDEDTSCLSNTWKTVASSLLIAILLGPWMYSSYKTYHTYSGEGAPAFLTRADQLGCAKKLNISFSQLYLDIKLNRMSLCQKNMIGCRCNNPTIPNDKNGKFRSRWYKGLERNKEMAASPPPISMSSLSAIPFWSTGWEPTWAFPIRMCQKVPKLSKELFEGHALPLALSGDRCNQLLYRMLNGEMPDTLNPTAWWILIGINDFADRCSKESILVGNLAVLEEVL